MKFIKSLGALLLSLLFACEAQATERVPAFPGADGYAKYVTGGRGGKVYYVTSLDDCTDDNLVPGTLRWALRSGDDSPRTILFAVHGTIYLNSKLKTNHPNVSILGQSAPGGGICLTGYPLYISRPNYIVRYIRFRAGDIPNESLTGLDVENAEDVIIDHCSMTWSMEECLTMFDVKRTTVQWCIIGEGLYNSKNSKGARAYATQWGGEQTSMLHCLITNSHSRSPRFNGVRRYEGQEVAHSHDYQVDSEFANNVVFNWSSYNSIYGGENSGLYEDEYNRVYMIGNYYRPGPSTQKGTTNRRYFVSASGSQNETGQWYLSGNKFETNSKWAPSTDLWSNNILQQIEADNLYGYGTNHCAMGYWSVSQTAEVKAATILDRSFYLNAKSEYEAESADEAFAHVTQQAGASLPRYDEVDSRLLAEAAGTIDPRFTGSVSYNAANIGIIDSPSDITLTQGRDTVTVQGTAYTYYPSTALREGDRYAIDNDGDGLPDAYETAHGLHPADPKDGAALAANCYSHLENYLNGIVAGEGDYKTSDTYVAPGLNARPEKVNISFACNDPSVQGVMPSTLQVNYGDEVVFAPNTHLYKEGHTLTGWTDNNMTYRLGQPYNIIEDVTLYPNLEQNSKNLEDRTADVTITWDFTQEGAPTLSPSAEGIFVTRGWLDSDSLDVCLTYHGLQLLMPAVAGAVVSIDYKDGSQAEYAAVEEVAEVLLTQADVRTVSISLPYIFDPTGIDFHSIAVDNGINYELVYGDTLTIDAHAWMHTLGQRRNAYRNCINPQGNDEVNFTGESLSGTTPLNGFIVGQSHTSTYKLVAYVKDCARVRTYVSGSNSAGDQVLLTAIPADGSDKLEAYNLHQLNKSAIFSEYFDLELDPTVSYMLVWSSLNGNDMMLGAMKFYDASAASAKNGNVTSTWTWTALNEDGSLPTSATWDPSKVFATSNVTTGQGWTVHEAFNGGIAQKPDAAIGASRDERYAVQFRLRPAAGFKFKPTQVSFFISMSGSCTFDVDVQQGAAQPLAIVQGDGATPTLTKHTYTVNGAELSGDECILSIYPYASATSSATARRFTLHSILIEGEYDSQVVKHRLSVVASPAQGGVVTISPRGTMFAETAQVVLTATPANGYLFQHWTNQSGDVLSSEAKFTYTIGTRDELLTAHFKNLAESDIFSDGPFQAIVSNAAELTEALAAARQYTEGRYYIFLRNGEYDFGTTALTAIPQNTSLIGEDQASVLLFNTPSADVAKYQEETPVLFIDQNQNNVYLQDLTVRQARDWNDKTSRGQAIALRQRGKQAIYKRVSLQGIQDTYYLNKADGTAYFEDCSIAGEVDFIYGDGTAFFQHCSLLPLSKSAIITAPNTQAEYRGMVFNECSIERSPEAKDAVTGYRLGRPWGDSPAATFLHTTMRVLPSSEGWSHMSDGLVVRFHEYDSRDAQGQPLDLSARSIAACAPAQGSDAPVLTESQAATYALSEVFPNWNPAEATTLLSAPMLQTSEGVLSWATVADAYCYAIVRDGRVVDFTSQNTYPCYQTGQYAIRVANHMGGLGNTSNTVEVETTGISTLPIAPAPITSFDLYGRRRPASQSGLLLQRGKGLLMVR